MEGEDTKEGKPVLEDKNDDRVFVMEFDRLIPKMDRAKIS